jgi:hypothetical protein
MQRIKPIARYPKPKRISVAEVIGNHGTVAQFARDLSNMTGGEISWGRVNAWKLRNNIPKSMVLHVHELTGIPLSKLL